MQMWHRVLLLPLLLPLPLPLTAARSVFKSKPVWYSVI